MNELGFHKIAQRHYCHLRRNLVVEEDLYRLSGTIFCLGQDQASAPAPGMDVY